MSNPVLQRWLHAIQFDPYFKNHFIHRKSVCTPVIDYLQDPDERNFDAVTTALSGYLADSRLTEQDLLASLVKLKSALLHTRNGEAEIAPPEKLQGIVQRLARLTAWACDQWIFNHGDPDRQIKEENTNILNLMLKALESVGEGIFIIEPQHNGIVLFVNKTMKTLSGYDPERFLMKPFGTLLGNYFTEELSREIFPAALEQGWQGEVTIQRVGLVPLSCHLDLQPVRDENKDIIAVVGILRDISREKRHRREMELREEQITWQNRRLSFLEDLSTILNATLDIKETLTSFSQKFAGIFPYKTLSIFLPVDGRKKHFRVYFSSTAQEPSRFPELPLLQYSEPLPPSHSPDQPTYYFEISAENFPNHEYFNELKTLQIAGLHCFPIFFQDELIGILNFCPAVPKSFSQDDLVFLEQIKRHLTVALKNCIQFDQLECQNRKLNFFHNLFGYIKNNISAPFVLNEALIDLTIAFSYDHLAIYQLTAPDRGKRLAHHSTKGISSELFPEDIHFETQIPDTPTLWIDALAIDKLKGSLGEKVQSIKPRTALMLTDVSEFYDTVLLIGLCEGYLADLSYNYHVEVMRSILREMTLALDHVLLFQQTLRAEKEWQTTFDEVEIGLAAVNPQWRITRANRTFWQIFNQPPQPGGLVPCRNLFDLSASETAVREKTQPTPIEAIEWEDPARQKQLVRRFFPFFNQKNQFVGGIFTVQDVTKERLREQHIRYLSRFAEVNPNIVLSLDLEGELIYMNKPTKLIIEHLNLESYLQLIPVTLLFELQNRSLKPGIAHEYIQNLNDRVFQFTAYLPEGEDNIYLYGIDMTERQMLQQKLIQTERMRIVGEVASGAAHDFNNFLTTILGRSQLLLVNATDENLIKELEVIEKAAKDGAEMVKRMQDLTPGHRIHSRSLKPLFLHEIIQDSLLFSFQKIKPQSQVRGQETNISTVLDKDLVVYGDRVELKEVFTNLIFNAVDAMPEGGTLSIKSYREPDSGQIVVLVRDTGVGMPPHIRQKIFEPFFSTKGESGTGLGLSLVYNFVTSHDGSIQVNSQPGEGTEFIMRFPPCEQLPDQPEPDREISRVISSHNTNLLVIDDELELVMTIAEVLKLKFKKVDMATSGREALEKIAREHYDVVLTDLGMPEMSGWDVAREVKNRLPKSKVILVTGWGMRAEKELTNHQYVDQVLSKPYDLHQLLTVIEQINSKS